MPNPPRRIGLVQQVTEQVKELIARDYPAGSKLPAESELAARLGVSRPTLREAIGRLWQEGLLQKKWGVGTIVLGSSDARRPGAPLSIPLMQLQPGPQLIRDSGVEPGVSHLSVTLSVADERMASLSDIRVGDEIWVIDRVLTAEGEPLMRAIDFVPRILKGRPFDASRYDALHNPLIKMLAEVPGCEMVSAEGVLTAVSADAETARRLAIPEGTAVLMTQQTGYAADGTTVAFTPTWYRSDRLDMRFSRSKGGPALAAEPVKVRRASAAFERREQAAPLVQAVPASAAGDSRRRVQPSR